LPPELTQTVKTPFAVRWKSLDRQDDCTAYSGPAGETEASSGGDRPALFTARLRYSNLACAVARGVVCFPIVDFEDFLPQFREVAERLEAHYEDVCDFEFTVQEGKLYVLQARTARRSPAAAIVIATDLFLEGRITGKTVIGRIAPCDVEAVLRPVIDMTSDIRQLGTGLPASAGAATGLAAFSSDSVLRLHSAGSPAVFMRAGFAPDDIQAMEAAVGIVSFLGGMTSHAAVISRGLGTPCVAGVGWSFNSAESAVVTRRGLLREGDPVTIDGVSGVIFKGSADLKVPNAMEDGRLLLLLRIIDALAAEDQLPDGYVGRAWGVRDLIAYGANSVHRNDVEGQVRGWTSKPGSTERYRACVPLKSTQLSELRKELDVFRLGHDNVDFVYLWAGLRGCFLRLLAKRVGLGRHPHFYRPLFDPCQAIVEPSDGASSDGSSQSRVQYVGEEFFSINHNVPEYIEIESIRIYWAVKCEQPHDLWRLDRTNPSGEKLLQGGADLLALKVIVNDAAVPLSQLPQLYNYLRRKEYFWDWYRANGLSRLEIMRILRESSPERSASGSTLSLLRRAGLIEADGSVTKVGRSLLCEWSAIDRVDEQVRVGW
jgi:phosphohistidine swiveling domain-containing protein